MRIVMDANIPLGREFFSSVGEVTMIPPRAIEREHLLQADGLVVRSVKKITGAMLHDTPVKFVGTCTAGFDHLDVAAMQNQNIHWCNAPGCNANSVVEYVISAISTLRANWLTTTVAIVGCGQVGGRLYKRLKQLGVRCLCYDPFLSLREVTSRDNPDLVSFEEIFAADIICLHTPYTTEGHYPTHHLFNSGVLQKIKTNGLLINAGRGGVIDNKALLRLLKSRQDLTCVLDVWEGEPQISSELLERVNIATPHIAGHSIDGKIKGTAMVYESLCKFFGIPPSVTLADLDQVPMMPVINIDANSIASAIKQATLAAYNIQADSERWLSTIEKTKNVATSFDQYRKNYPPRREFFHYTVKVNNQGPEIKKALAIIGFKIL